MKYTIIFGGCGHEGVVELFGKGKDREWKLGKMKESGICPLCYKKQMEEERKAKREEELKKNELFNQLHELPDLAGSEKQVAWAMSIRTQFYQECIKESLRKGDNQLFEKVKEFFKSSYQGTAARFWIDRRNNLISSLLKEIEDTRIVSSEEKKVEKEAKEEAIIWPKDSKTKTTAEIIIENEKIIVLSDKNEIIINVLKEYNYHWNSDEHHWELKLTNLMGAAEDRAAEIANKLLLEGVPIIAYSQEVKIKAIYGTFKRLHTRWVTTQDNLCKIKWSKKEDYFKQSKLLPSARWKDGGMLISPKYYDEIIDFADIYNFKITEGAKKLLEQERLMYEGRLTVEPADIKEKITEDKLKTILESSREIIDDLRDE